MRALFFCNEMLGLGHVSLALAIADAFVAVDETSTALVVTGSPACSQMRAPPRVDVVKLPTPPVSPDTEWSRSDRRAAAWLAMDVAEVHRIRAELSLAAARSFAPDVALTDYRALGYHEDLVPALEQLRSRGDCATGLGLWEVDDAHDRTRAMWSPDLAPRIAVLYDLALLYGQPEPGDPRVEVLHAAGIPIHETDPIARRASTSPAADLGEGYLLATVGGGADGFELLAALIDAARVRSDGLEMVLVTGPLMPAASVAELRERSTGLPARVFETRPDLGDVMAGARVIVAMAGYNTTGEVLASGKPALLVPRTFPSEEQFNRARRLAAAGRVSMLTPDQLAPERVNLAIDELLARQPAPPEATSGAGQVAALLRRAVTDRRSGAES